MKLRISLLCFLFLTTSGGRMMAISSEKGIKIKSDKITLLAAIERISQEYEVYFTFDMTLVSDVEVEYEDRSYSSAQEAVSHILKGTNLKYKFYDQRFVILYREDAEGLESLKQMSRHLDGLISEGERTITSAPKREIRAIPRLSSRFLSREIQRIAFTVEGKVVDQNGEPLIGVNIQVKGSNKGTATDFDGNFILEDIDENAVLVISYVGYQTLEVSVSGRSNITITMTSDSQLLDEVVVVGYGTQKRTSLTAAVNALDGADLAKAGAANISHTIAGRAPGINIMPNTGEPGDNPTIYIRGVGTMGNSKPLIVINGIARNDISDVDPSIIESISVLKDAAAVAPYGLGGANGVLLITTKEGDEGKMRISINTSYGYENPIWKPNPLSAEDYMKLLNEATINVSPGSTPPYSYDYIENYSSNHNSDPDRYPDSRTVDLLNKNIPIQKHNISISGGSDKITYFFAGGFYKENGLFDQVNFNNYNYNIGMTSKITNSTKINISLINSIHNKNELSPRYSTGNMMRWMYFTKPTSSLYYSNGLWGDVNNISLVGALKSESFNNKNRNRLYSSFTINQEIPFVSGLGLKGVFSFDTNNDYTKAMSRPAYYWTQDLSTDPYTYTRKISNMEQNSESNPELFENLYRGNQYTYQGHITYSRTFLQNHDFNVIGVVEMENRKFHSLNTSMKNLLLNIDEFDLGSSDKNDLTLNGNSEEEIHIGYLYRVNYSYSDKYLFETSGRYDGHYYFAPGKRFAFFPAVSIGWRLLEEEFIPTISNIHDIKLRASWGKSGNLAGGPFQYLFGYNFSPNQYSFNGNMVSAAYSRIEANPDITWEISDKSNIGFDLDAGNFIMGFDYFWEKRSGMLLPPATEVPYEYGIDLAEENSGIMANKGFETFLSYRINYNDISIKIGGNLSFARNKMIEIYETSSTYNNPNRRRTGRPLNTPFGYKSLGLFKMDEDINDDGIINEEDGYNINQFGPLHPGDIKYADINGDGKIDSDDRVAIGFPTFPELFYGVTLESNWKFFDFSVFFQGAGRYSFQINNRFQTVSLLNTQSNTDYEYYNNRWTPQNQNSKYPRSYLGPNANNNSPTSDFWYKRGDYLRLKTIEIGFKFLRNTDFSPRIFFSGVNVITFSKIDFFDPESIYNANGAGVYPMMKQFNFGLNLSF